MVVGLRRCNSGSHRLRPRQQNLEHSGRRQGIGRHKPGRHAKQDRAQLIVADRLARLQLDQPLDQRFGPFWPQQPGPLIPLRPGNRIIDHKAQPPRAIDRQRAGGRVARRITEQHGRNCQHPIAELIDLVAGEAKEAQANLARHALEQVGDHIDPPAAVVEQGRAELGRHLAEADTIGRVEHLPQQAQQPVMLRPVKPEQERRPASQFGHLRPERRGEIVRTAQHLADLCVAAQMQRAEQAKDGQEPARQAVEPQQHRQHQLGGEPCGRALGN